jgi:hypothetical protein
MVYSGDELKPLKLYENNELILNQENLFSKQEIDKFEENEFKLLSGNNRMLFLLPHQQNGIQKYQSYANLGYRNKRIKMINEFSSSDNFENTDVLLIHNPKKQDWEKLIYEILENQNESIIVNQNPIKIPKITIISLVKQELMNHYEMIEYLKEKNYLDIFEFDLDFKIINNPDQQIINFNFNNINNINNINNGNINHYYQENQELSKKVKELEEKVNILFELVNNNKTQSPAKIEKT